MSDFRVPLSASDPNYEQELDWGGRKWTLSERETGLGARWQENLSPSLENLVELADFFRIDKKLFGDLAHIASLSPGELALLHQNSVENVSVYAYLCEKCAMHWYIFRWELDKNAWAVYGRDCDYSWRRGHELNDEEKRMLESVLGDQYQKSAGE